VDERPASPDDLLSYTGDAPLPTAAGQSCPPVTPPVALSNAETACLLDLVRDYRHGRLSAARLAFHLRWSRWRGFTRPAPAGITTSPGLSPDLGRLKGDDGM